MHFSCQHIYITLFTQIYPVVVQKMQHFVLFRINLHYIMIKLINAGTSTSNGAIWDKFSEEHKHKSNKNSFIQCLISTILVQIRCRFITHFSW